MKGKISAKLSINNGCDRQIFAWVIKIRMKNIDIQVKAIRIREIVIVRK